MNKLKIESKKRVIETQTIHFKEVAGLFAVSVIETRDEDNPCIKSTNFYYNGKQAFVLKPESIDDYIIDVSDSYYNTKFYEKHVAPNIEAYSTEDLKHLDLSSLYTFEYNNIFGVKGDLHEGRWFLLDYDNVQMQCDKLYDYVHDLGYERQFVDHDSWGYYRMRKCKVSTADFPDHYVLMDDRWVFNSKTASEELVTKWLESK